jgi:hypothetical protein
MRYLREAAITVCGLVALISPVVLWTAWSKPVFYAVLAAGCGAILIIYLLVVLSPDEEP